MQASLHARCGCIWEKVSPPRPSKTEGHCLLVVSRLLFFATTTGTACGQHRGKAVLFVADEHTLSTELALWPSATMCVSFTSTVAHRRAHVAGVLMHGRDPGDGLHFLVATLHKHIATLHGGL